MRPPVRENRILSAKYHGFLEPFSSHTSPSNHPALPITADARDISTFPCTILTATLPAGPSTSGAWATRSATWHCSVCSAACAARGPLLPHHWPSTWRPAQGRPREWCAGRLDGLRRLRPCGSVYGLPIGKKSASRAGSALVDGAGPCASTASARVRRARDPVIKTARLGQTPLRAPRGRSRSRPDGSSAVEW